MYKATVIYATPTSPEAFDKHYEQVHIPIAMRIPGISHWTVTAVDQSPDGTTPSAYLTAELYAPSREALLRAFDSPEGRAAAADVARFADGGVQYLFGDERVVTTTPAFGAGR